MRYRFIAFDLDQVLVKEWTIYEITKKFNLHKEFQQIDDDARNKKIKQYQVTIKLAKLLKGKKISEIHKFCTHLHLANSACKVINELRISKIKTGIITTQISPISEFFSEALKVDYLICPKLSSKGDILTGEVDFKKYFDKNCPYDKKRHSICKRLALIELVKIEKISLDECIVVGDSASDMCMLKVAGLGIGINPSEEIENLVDVKVNKLTDILKFL